MSDLGLLAADAVNSLVELELVTCDDFSSFSAGLSQNQQNWLQSCAVVAKPGACLSLPGDGGVLAAVLLITADYDTADMAQFWAKLPACDYKFSKRSLDLISATTLQAYVLDFARCYYSFIDSEHARPRLAVPDLPDWLLAQIAAEQRLRDLINTPTEELSTDQFASEIKSLAQQYNAEVEVFKDDLQHSFPAVWAVGRASSNSPQVVNLKWGDSKHPRLALVGKGVCYDSGGLNLKHGNSMLLMKKDMSGAAHALALAEMIMATELPVQLDVWIPIAENSIDGDSYRPGDVINSRAGKRIEITNTDAEGRLLLADAITAASANKPKLLLDFASLTGAARVALGPDLVPVFAANTDVAALQKNSLLDDFWELPLYARYKNCLNSEIADIMNSSLKGMAGAITAALFLQEFVPQGLPWLHFDIFAHDSSSGAKASVGARAQGLTGCYHFVANKLLETNNG